MHNVKAGLLTLLLTALSGHAQPDSLWSRNFGGNSLDEARSVRQTMDGGYIIAGSTYGTGAGLWDVLLLKLDSAGDVQWSRTFGGPQSDSGSDVLQTADGGYMVAGSTMNYGAGNYDAWLIRTDAGGDSLWSRTYGGSLNDYAASLEPTTDGGYILGGTNLSFSNGYEDLWMVKTDADGNLQWHRTYGESGFDYGVQARQSSDGGYVVAGYTDAQDGGTYAWVFKTDADGNEQWDHLYGDLSPSYCYDIIQTNDGGYALCGYTYFGGLMIKTDGAGNQQWQQLHDATFTVLEQTSDDGYVLTGYRYIGSQYDFLLLKTDGEGEEQWSRTYGRSGQDHSYAFSPTNDGGYVLAGTGENNGTGHYDVWVLKTTPDQVLPAPENLVIQPIGADIHIAWNAVGGPGISYSIFSDLSSAGQFQTLVGTTTDTAFVDVNALERPEPQRFYVVTALTP